MMSSPLVFSDSVIRFKKRKARFSFSEVHVLLDEVRKNRTVVVGKFNRGVPTDTKKRIWSEITARVNEIGECQREVMEVIKKWSDLKCDTKRKVAAMRSGTVPNRGLNSRLSRDLNPTEKMVLQILEMDDDEERRSPIAKDDDDEVERSLASVADDDDDVAEEDDEEEEMMRLQTSPNAGGAPAGKSADSSLPVFDLQYEAPPTEDPDNLFDDSDESFSPKPSNETTPNDIETQTPSVTHSNASHPVTPVNASHPVAPGNVSMMQNAWLSLQEQHATNTLLETVSRSLELLSESVQQLVESHQEFVGESLRLQRHTVQVLRDFTGGAIALIHHKLNGRPAL